MTNRAVVTFNDPRRFGSMSSCRARSSTQDRCCAALGPEPLGNAFDAAMLARACAGKKTSLKAALLDQRVVAGLGNIYVCEALHRARPLAEAAGGDAGDPSRRSRTSARERLVDAIKAVLEDAIEAGGSSLRDHRRTDGELGDFQHNFRVYDREGKPLPDARLRRHHQALVQAGRSTFYCPLVSAETQRHPCSIPPAPGDIA